MAKKGRKKKTSKPGRVVLYVPETFDPDVHLPVDLRSHADEARYLLHTILVGRSQKRDDDKLVRLKRDYLDRFIPDRRCGLIRDALEQAGVIEVKRTFVIGGHCFGYRLLPPHDGRVIRHQPSDLRLLKKLKARRTEESNEVRLPLHKTMRKILKRVTIDVDAAREAITGSEFKRSLQAIMIARIESKDFSFVADRFGRVHSNLTNLKSTLRRFLRVGGTQLVNLDIVNSQPIIFCLILGSVRKP